MAIFLLGQVASAKISLGPAGNIASGIANKLIGERHFNGHSSRVRDFLCFGQSFQQ
jgi:hypothetical protein